MLRTKIVKYTWVKTKSKGEMLPTQAGNLYLELKFVE